MGDSPEEERPDIPPAEPSEWHASGFATLEAPTRLFVPCPSDSAPVKPVWTSVSAGEALIDGEGGYEHVPVAPVAGHIVDIARAMLSNGREMPVVVLEPDQPLQPPVEPAPISIEGIAGMLSGMKPQDLQTSIGRLRDAGVWADRWTSPDLMDQLHACLRSRPDFVLCTLLDADRSLGINLACAVQYPAEIVAAVAALARLSGVGRAWITVDAEDDGDARPGLQRVAAQVAGDLRFIPVENDYPQADPTLLVYALTGRRLRPGRLPTDQGVLLLDAAAALAIGRTLLLGEPMLSVPVAVHDRSAVSADADPAVATRLLSVPVGTPLSHILDRLDVGSSAGRRGMELWAGAPLRERRLASDCIIAGGELGIFVAPREPSINPDPCIRCGWCVEGCPVDAHPAALLDAAQRGDAARAEPYGLNDCIECGICSYVCPSHLPLLQGIRTLRVGKP